MCIRDRSKTPPFTIENDTDGGDELRMKYRYLDIRRDEIKNNLLLRNRLSFETRKYLNKIDFIEVTLFPILPFNSIIPPFLMIPNPTFPILAYVISFIYFPS